MIKAAILVLLLSVAVVAAVPSPEEQAFATACQMSGYKCEGLRRPFVVEAPLGGLYGRYRMGDKYVLIKEDLDEKLAFAVTVHEMVHYLQFKNGAWTFTHENRCAMEKEAFDVSNTILARTGALEHVVDWNKAKVWYGCAPKDSNVIHPGKLGLHGQASPR